MNELWSFEHSIECPVARSVAWQFWTHVDNWKLDADVEAAELRGPFVAGSEGTTVTRSSGRLEWRLAAVQPETSALIEIVVPDGIGRFLWTFADAAIGTRLTQRVSISGGAALLPIDRIARAFEEGIPAGMQKLCTAMAAAASIPASAPHQPASG